MPAELHKKLEKEALKKFGSTTSERARKYIYGTMQTVELAKKHKKKKMMMSGMMKK